MNDRRIRRVYINEDGRLTTEDGYYIDVPGLTPEKLLEGVRQAEEKRYKRLVDIMKKKETGVEPER